MLRLSLLLLFACSILVAQTDIIVRKLILRDAADNKFWTLSQDLATPDTTTIFLKDDTGAIVLDWDAQIGAKFFTDIITIGNVILDGNELQFRNASGSLTGHKVLYGSGANVTFIKNSVGDVVVTLDSALTPAKLTINSDMFMNGNLNVMNAFSAVRVLIDESGDNGRIHILNDAGNIAAIIGTEGTGGQADSGYLSIEDSSSRPKFEVGIDSGGDPFISMEESGSGTSEEIHIEARAAELGSNSILIKNSSGAERVKIGVRDTSEAGGAVAVLSASGDSVAMISSTTITSGVYVGADKVVGAQEPLVGSTAPDLTWSANERDMLQDICTALENHGMIANSTCL